MPGFDAIEFRDLKSSHAVRRGTVLDAPRSDSITT